MEAKIKIKQRLYSINLANPIDISIPIQNTDQQVKAFHAPDISFQPLIAGNFVGAVDAGSPVNFKNIHINPHGNGTHTECVGHITNEGQTINQTLTDYFFFARLVTIEPTKQNNDSIITREQLANNWKGGQPEALIIRTTPNGLSKMTYNYSGTNPPYLTPEAVAFLVEKNIQHLLLDLPSVDKEEDGGELASHKMFWQYPTNTRNHATITELIYVPDAARDGFYILNLQIASFELDASPSKPILYQIE